MTKPGFEPGTSPYLARACYHYTTRPFGWRNHQLQQGQLVLQELSVGGGFECWEKWDGGGTKDDGSNHGRECGGKESARVGGGWG